MAIKKFDKKYEIKANLSEISLKIESICPGYLKGNAKDYDVSYFICGTPSGSIFLKDKGETTLMRVQTSGKNELSSLDGILSSFKKVKNNLYEKNSSPNFSSPLDSLISKK